MKNLTISVLMSAFLASATGVRDMAGRTVELELPVRTVYSTGPIGEIFMYTLAPEKVCGLSWKLRPREHAWLLPSYTSLPVLGGWVGKSANANLEELARIRPGMILAGGNVDAQARSNAERLQGQVGRPVLMIDLSLDSTDAAYRLLGRVLGKEARADTLARFCRKVLNEVKAHRAARKGTKAPRIYYAEGLKGLETDPSASMHAQPLDVMGVTNVAAVPFQAGFGRSPVSFEQLLSWDPDWILVGEDHTDAADPGTLSRLKADPRWRMLRAVRTGHIVRIPDIPFNWFDRPPAPGRILGLSWLESVLFPAQRSRAQFLADMRTFFPLFYHRKLTAADEAQILKDAFPR